MLSFVINSVFLYTSPAHPESTEHLVDEKLDLVFGEMTSHLRQVSKHVRHHQVTGEKTRGETERVNGM